MTIQNAADKNELGYICGKNAVTEMLKSKSGIDTLFVADLKDRSFSYIISLARQAGAVVKQAHPLKLSSMSGSEQHQGVVALCRLCEYRETEDLFEKARSAGQPPFFIVTDGIEDPHNLGAIIRTAECAGAHGVVIPKRRGCAVTPAVFRASAGAVSHVPIVRTANIAAFIRDIKARGVFCYCAEANGELCYTEDLTGPAALVVGSEGFGVSRLVRDLCDKAISLPVLGVVGSLNASVAAGVLMYEFVRQSKAKGVQG